MVLPIRDHGGVNESTLAGGRHAARGPAVSPLRRGELRRRGGGLWLLPALCAAVYVLAVIANFHAIITAVYVNSDAALAPVLAQAAAHLPAGSYISLGNHAWYEEWLLLQATRSLSFHRGLWELAPAIWTLLGAGLLVWSARRALDAWSASITGAALLCAGAFGRFTFLAVNWHSLSLVHTILIGAVLLWLAERIERVRRAPLIAVAIAVGALSALPAASDALFAFWAMIPLIGVCILLGSRASGQARRLLALFAVTVLAVTIAGAIILAAVMRHDGITARALPVGPVAVGSIGHNIALLARSLAFLGGGRIDVLGAGAGGVLALLGGWMVLLALAVVLVALAATCLRRGLRREVSAARLAYVAFWSQSLICSVLVFVLTDAPKDALSGRYLLAGYAAIAALLPLAGTGTRSRRLLTAGVCAYALIAAYQVINRPFTVITSPEVAVRLPGPETAAQLAAFARSENVSVGYGGYWDAEELTWATHFAVPVRPVRVCSNATHALCYPQLGMISSWYRPRAGIRSLLIVDSLGTSFNGILAADPQLGAPVAERRIGPVDVLVYPYDIASRIRAPLCHFSWAHPC